MRLLPDTHTPLWWVLDDPRLSARARAAIEAASNTIFVSAATAWFRGTCRHPGARFCGSDAGWAACDPFDRLLIAQSQVEGLTVVTDDQAIRGYQVSILW